MKMIARHPLPSDARPGKIAHTLRTLISSLGVTPRARLLRLAQRALAVPSETVREVLEFLLRQTDLAGNPASGPVGPAPLRLVTLDSSLPLIQLGGDRALEGDEPRLLRTLSPEGAAELDPPVRPMSLKEWLVDDPGPISAAWLKAQEERARRLALPDQGGPELQIYDPDKAQWCRWNGQLGLLLGRSGLGRNIHFCWIEKAIDQIATSPLKADTATRIRFALHLRSKRSVTADYWEVGNTVALRLPFLPEPEYLAVGLICQTPPRYRDIIEVPSRTADFIMEFLRQRLGLAWQKSSGG